ncbi:MAG: FAD-dependent monooxygenase [Micropruina sp.]|nr:FAD-dependent monooxygenase [Micropruina sp.]
MTRHQPLDIAVLGAGPIGLTAALLLARDGHHVVVVDADPGPGATDIESWHRPGVSQFAMPHVLLPRWRHELASALPDLIAALRAAGAAPLNTLHQQPDEVTQGWWPHDEALDTLAARRRLVEWVLLRQAEADPRIEVRRPVTVTGLLLSSDAQPVVTGLRTEQGTLPADLVIDASGRHSRVPGWVLLATGPTAPETRSEARVTYYCRDFHSPDGPPPRVGAMLTHHPSWSMIGLPADHGRYAIVLATWSGDAPLRALRDPARWQAAVRGIPAGAAWLDHGRPVGDVLVHGGGADVVRDYCPGGQPLLDGLVCLGDARAVTMPLLGRGLTLGTLDALALRDALRPGVRDRHDATVAHAEAHRQRLGGLIDATLWFGRHRAAELKAEAAGVPYSTDDAGWAMTTALRLGAEHDPVLARASSGIGGLLATPAEVFADPDVRNRAGRHLGGPAHLDGPTRADLLSALAGTPPTSPTDGEDPSTQGVHHVRIRV